MADPALFRRNAAAAALVSSAVLGAASRFLARPPGGRPAQLLAAIQAAPGRTLASAVLFVVYALPAMIGALGLAHLLRGRFPTLSNVGATLAVVGAFADAVAGSFPLVYVQMAQDRIGSGAFAAVVTDATRVEGLFSLVGLAGTVVGTLLLSIGLFRASVGPRWAPALVWVFLVLEFAGSGAVPQLGLGSVTVGVIAYGALASTVRRTPRSAWVSGVEAELSLPAVAVAS